MKNQLTFKNGYYYLPNGARVLSIDFAGGVVLADNGREYVTWEFNRSDMQCFWGHYIQYGEGYETAKSDFMQRCTNNGALKAAIAAAEKSPV